MDVQTTDPLPEGKKLDAEPKHHFNAIDAPDHDPSRLMHRNEAATAPQEVEKMQRRDREHVVLYDHDVQAGMDWLGSSTQANKKMSSAHRHAGQVPSGKTHPK